MTSIHCLSVYKVVLCKTLLIRIEDGVVNTMVMDIMLLFQQMKIKILALHRLLMISTLELFGHKENQTPQLPIPKFLVLK